VPGGGAADAYLLGRVRGRRLDHRPPAQQQRRHVRAGAELADGADALRRRHGPGSEAPSRHRRAAGGKIPADHIPARHGAADGAYPAAGPAGVHRAGGVGDRDLSAADFGHRLLLRGCRRLRPCRPPERPGPRLRDGPDPVVPAGPGRAGHDNHRPPGPARRENGPAPGRVQRELRLLLRDGQRRAQGLRARPVLRAGRQLRQRHARHLRGVHRGNRRLHELAGLHDQRAQLGSGQLQHGERQSHPLSRRPRLRGVLVRGWPRTRSALQRHVRGGVCLGRGPGQAGHLAAARPLLRLSLHLPGRREQRQVAGWERVEHRLERPVR
jgi:hypothetical protein